jgi:hypothetical protein
MLQSLATFQQPANNENTPSQLWMNEMSKENNFEGCVLRKHNIINTSFNLTRNYLELAENMNAYWSGNVTYSVY